MGLMGIGLVGMIVYIISLYYNWKGRFSF
jgi:hypothetical protein